MLLTAYVNESFLVEIMKKMIKSNLLLLVSQVITLTPLDFMPLRRWEAGTY